jgi:hypothetical protein
LVCVFFVASFFVFCEYYVVCLCSAHMGLLLFSFYVVIMEKHHHLCCSAQKRGNLGKSLFFSLDIILAVLGHVSKWLMGGVNNRPVRKLVSSLTAC